MTFEDTIADTESLLKLKKLKLKELKFKADYEYAKKERAKLEEEVFDRLENANIQSMNIDNSTLYRKTTIYASIKKTDKENGLQWLMNNGYDSIIQETVNANTLSAVMKEFIAEGGEIPECISIFTKKSIGIKNLNA